MKLVVNKCFGGFGLSDEAENLYAKKSGFEIFRYAEKKSTDYEDKTFIRSDGTDFMSFTFTKDHGDEFKWGNRGDYGYWYSREIPRDDVVLVEVVEELGEKANGEFANLCVVEIPDDVQWKIEEYDGMEHVSEEHRTW